MDTLDHFHLEHSLAQLKQLPLSSTSSAAPSPSLDASSSSHDDAASSTFSVLSLPPTPPSEPSTPPPLASSSSSSVPSSSAASLCDSAIDQRISIADHRHACTCDCSSSSSSKSSSNNGKSKSRSPRKSSAVSRTSVQRYAADVVRREAQALLDLAARLDSDAIADCDEEEERDRESDSDPRPDSYDAGHRAPPSSTDASFAQAVELLSNMHPHGRIIMTGVGKSGLLARKAVATFNSFGIPSAFLHPLEALHGDLGLLSPYGLDVVILVSYSGRTTELLHLLRHLRHRHVRGCISLSSPDSALADACDVNIDVSLAEDEEADQGGVPAPTSSVVTALAALDALALTLLRLKTGWDAHPAERKKAFGIHHPGGSLGQQLSAQLE